MSSTNVKDPFTESKKEIKKVRVKFNFPLSSQTFDPSIALKKAKEEKSYIAFDLQSHIDINTVSNFYEAGKVYEVSEEFYNKFSERKVETYNKNFGNFQGKAQKFAKRPTVPYLIKVDAEDNYLNQMDRELDLYAKED